MTYKLTAYNITSISETSYYPVKKTSKVKVNIAADIAVSTKYI